MPVGLVVAALALCGCGNAQVRYQDHLQRGERFLAQGNLPDAGVELRNALQIEPKSATALYDLGRVVEAQGNFRQAAGLFQSAIDAQPDDTRARVDLGMIYCIAGAPRQALATISPALSRQPDDADLLTVRAAAERGLKENEAAMVDAEQAVRLAPVNENAVALLAMLDKQDGHLDRAVAVVSRAVGQSPGSVDLRSLLTNLYIAAGQLAQAEGQMTALLALRPRDLPLRLQLANLYMKAGDRAAAQSALETAVNAFPDDDDAKLALAQFVAATRSVGEGRETLARFLTAKPDDDTLRFGLGTLEERAGSPADAIASYQEIVRRDGVGGTAVAARERIAAIEASRAQYPLALGTIRQILAVSPTDANALVLRADIALRQHDPATAIQDLRAVLRDRPDSLPLERLLTYSYIAKGDTALAEAALRSAMSAHATDVPTRLDLAALLAKTDRPDEAQALLQETAHQAPDDPRPLVALARLDAERGDIQGALQAYDGAVKVAPSLPQLTVEAATFEEKQGRIREAIGRYQTLYESAAASAVVRQLAANNLAMLLVTYRRDRASLERARALTSGFAASPVPSLLDTYGWVHYQCADYRAALPALQRAAAQAPQSKIIRFHLGMTELSLGERARAREDLEAALAGSASFSGADQARSTLASLKLPRRSG
ncbi:MAG TPA: tetratricopeptide repeat protein [Steroidobacteraceae bacterium]|nr:tetratricopeptide repeat protein [Steroidobacteraceae bacterium]